MVRRGWIILGVVALITIAIALYRQLGWAPAAPTQTRLAVDLADPDAIVRTSSLARLPRDLLRVPLLRDVLTEDFVYYYEQHEDRLGLGGLLRRVAYEYQLDWSDRLVTALLDEPASVAFWRDGKGALRHFAIVIRRNTLAKVAQEAATVALKDTQVTRPAALRDGTSVYALKLNPRRTLLAIARGERAVILSHTGLALDADGKLAADAEEAISRWLADDEVLARSFALGAPVAPASGQAQHTVAVGARAMTLGYGALLASAKALRFDFNGSDWSSAMLVDPARLPKQGLGDAELWRGVPANAAACVSLPLDFAAMRAVVSNAPAALPGAEVLAAADGTAAACWYREASLYAPLFVGRVADPQTGAAVAKAIGEWAIAAPKPATNDAKDGEAKEPKRIDKITFTPTAVARDGYVLFSPDKRLVDLALDTLARKFPNAGEQFAGGGATVALVTPRTLADMAMREAMSALSGPGDERLREATKTLLPGRLKALAQHPPYQVALDGAPPAIARWMPLQWHALQERR